MGKITVKNLGKAYKRYPGRWSRLAEWVLPGKKARHELNWVLQDINFTIAAGEAVGIVGINGAGKSTLLKIITGTTTPTTGSVEMTGRVAALLELGMGFHPDFTGRQNVYMAGQLLGLTVADIDLLMPDIEGFAEIGKYIDQPVRMYSSGMQVRLAFSVSTAARPDILIVDEALSVGDAYFQAKCFQRIKLYKEKGTTLLLVSHSSDDIVKHCDRAIMLKGGRVEVDDEARIVTNRYLDELFGKKVKGEMADLAPPEFSSSSLSEGERDEFHTRSGYSKEEHRWGHGGASILDYLIVANGVNYPSRIDSNTTTEFYFKVKFEKFYDNVVPGFLIKSLEGIFLYGTNSFIASNGRESATGSPGEIKTFCFKMPLALNEGHYLISFGISAGDPSGELTPLDRRYDSVMVYVSKKLQFWGIVDLNASFWQLEAEIETK